MTRQDFLQTFPGYLKSYKPSPESLDKIKNTSLLIVIGPTGVGKSTIIDQLDFPYVPSDTTRPPRRGEVDGKDMFFLNDYDQVMADIKAGKFLQFVVGASGDLYATRASSFPSDGWATMPVISSVVPYFRQLGFKKTLSVFITPPNYEEWLRRMDTHKTEESELQKRLKEAKASFEFALSDPQTRFVLNDELNMAVERVNQVVNGQNPDGEQKARTAAQTIFKRLVAAAN